MGIDDGNLQLGEVVDRYTVRSFIGQGGMANVYKVQHNVLESEHALKVLTVTSASIKRRLLQEGRVQARLRHPNIVSVTDIVDVKGCPGLIMELVEGPTLEEFCVGKRLRLAQVDALALGILAGVAEAHAQQLIHRDLKPANIMLARTSSGLVPKVADFGLVKVLASDVSLSRTRSGLTMGTPRYMSPEQIRDAKKVDHRADVFSLGAILYELVTGQPAFPGEDTLELFNAIDDGRYRPPRECVPALPDRMDQAIRGALVSRASDRIASVAELIAIWQGQARPAPAAAPPAAASQTAAPRTAGTTAGSADPTDPLPDPAEPEPLADAPEREDASNAAGPAPSRSDSLTLPEAPRDDAADAHGAPPPARPSAAAAAGAEDSPTPDDPVLSSAPPEEVQTQRRALPVLVALVLLSLGGGAWWALGDDPAPSAPPRTAPTTAAAPEPAVPVEAPGPAAAPEPEPEPAGTPDAGAAPTQAKAPTAAAPRPVAAAKPAAPKADRGAPIGGAPPAEAPTPTPSPTPGPAPSAEPRPTPTAAAEAPPAEPDPSQATVRFTGARKIWLEADGVRHPGGGAVPPGTYNVLAFFEGVDPVRVKEIRLEAGQEITLKCSAELRICR